MQEENTEESEKDIATRTIDKLSDDEIKPSIKKTLAAMRNTVTGGQGFYDAGKKMPAKK